MNCAPPPTQAARGLTLYDAVAQLERYFGAGFVHNPARWGTADGTIEYRHAHLYADQMRRQQAAERLHLARAAVMSQPGERQAAIARDDERIAHGDA